MLLPHIVLIIFLLLTVPFSVNAGKNDAHTHGVATLSLALEGDLLDIQFESPASNIVGFEHKATSAIEKELVAQSEMKLKRVDQLFSFSESDCQTKSTKVDTSGIVDIHRDEHEHHGHHHDHGKSSHSEISARYQFVCKDPKHLSSIDVGIIKQFPGLEKINVMWITQEKQGGATLTSKHKTILLR